MDVSRSTNSVVRHGGSILNAIRGGNMGTITDYQTWQESENHIQIGNHLPSRIEISDGTGSKNVKPYHAHPGEKITDTCYH